MKYTIITFGCQMNEADSRLMAAVLDQAGWEEGRTAAEADLIVVNTCSVREKPEQKVRSLLGELRAEKEARPRTVLAVVGCMAQSQGARLVKRAPYVDLVLGTRCFHRIGEAVERLQRGERPVVITDLDDDPATLRCELEMGRQLRAFVPVILGCTNFCSYCLVPHVRGKETSRPLAQIVAEVETLVRRNTREVTLLGQNVLAYGRDLRDRSTFEGLLPRLNEIEGLWRIRFTTCHPRDVTPGLIGALRLPKVCEHLHLPIQAGTDKLLREMNRGYTVAEYRATVEALRAGVPDLAITTDIMVGFPGETDEDYAESLRVYQELGFGAAFTFAYSERPGTAAAERADQVPREIRIARLNRLIEMQNRITRDRNAAEVGRVAEVLVEGPAEKGEGLLAGKTRQNKQVVFPGPAELIGRLVQVRLVEAELWGFRGSDLRSDTTHRESPP